MDNPFTMSAAEVKRRLDKVAMLREATLRLRAVAREAYHRGEFPYLPPQDIRSDPEYWRRKIGGAGTPDSQ